MKCIFKMTLLAAIFCCLNPLFAQEEKTTEYSLKLYHNYFLSVNKSEYNSTMNVSSNAGSITPSFLISKPKTFHEIELAYLRSGRWRQTYETDSISGNPDRRSYSFKLQLKYEYGVNLLTVKEKLRFSLSAAAEPFLIFDRDVDNLDDRLSRRVGGGTLLFLIPRGTYSIGKRWFVDVNFPVEMMQFYAYRGYIAPPLQGENVFTNSYVNFFDNILRFRVGIGLKL